MNILIFGAHPDDIEIGLGGTVAKHVDSGSNVLGVVVTVPYSEKERKNEALMAANILGCELRFLDISPNDMVFGRMMVNELDKAIDEFKPDIVYTHWEHDSHQDHVAVAKSTIAATRKNNCSVFMYEQTIPGGLVGKGFKPQLVVDITSTIDRKLESTGMHITPIKNMDELLNGLKGRASYRGYQVSAEYAEAFEVVKLINFI